MIAILQGLICATFGPYYFVLLIIQLYLLHPLIVKVVKIRQGGILIILNVSSFFMFNIILKNYEVPFVFLVSPFIYWISFYAIGVYFSSHNRNYSIWISLIFVIFGALAQFASCYYTKVPRILEYEAIFAGWLYSVSAWTYEMGIIMLLFAKSTENLYNKNEKLFFPIRFIGPYAFGIYLCHVYTQYFIEKYTSVETWAVKWIVMTTLSILLILILGSIIPKRVQRYFDIK